MTDDQKNHWVPFLYFDYQRDTKTLTMIEHGAYLLLLIHCWETHGPVPLDEHAAFRIARAMTVEEQDAVRKILRIFFKEKSSGFHNKKAEKIAKKQKEKRLKLAENGRKGGRAFAQAKSEHLPKHDQRQRQSEKEKIKRKSPPGVLAAWQAGRSLVHLPTNEVFEPAELVTHDPRTSRDNPKSPNAFRVLKERTDIPAGVDYFNAFQVMESVE